MMRLLAAILVLLASSCTAIESPHVGGDVHLLSGDSCNLDEGAGAKHDRVRDLPGAPDGEPLSMYSGYITVNEDHGRALFYALTLSESAPCTDPVVLWLNGGPGCSSLGGGLMSEMGPIYPTKSAGLQVNPYRWNKRSSMLFLDSPAMVGFSYSNTTSDAAVGDARTAADARIFLLKFFERFPHLADNDFYISGESYGGHYVPGLALEIHNGNAAGGDPPIPLKGFLVGNAWTHAPLDNLGAVQMWASHALISRDTAQGILDDCDLSNVGPLRGDGDESCDSHCDAATAQMGNINIYDIYVDVCVPASRLAATRALAAAQPAAVAPRIAAALEASASYDPCVDDEVATYLNRPEVQAALHANTTGSVPGPWTDCSSEVEYSREDLLRSMLPTYQQLLADAGLRILVYSGDVDGIVPVIGTQNWIETLALPVTEAWQPWHVAGDPQVAGYVTRYERDFTFATVRNAGHMVPYTQPERALELFTQYLQGGM